jgi:hypothetical protein
MRLACFSLPRLALHHAWPVTCVELVRGGEAGESEACAVKAVVRHRRSRERSSDTDNILTAEGTLYIYTHTHAYISPLPRATQRAKPEGNGIPHHG